MKLIFIILIIAISSCNLITTSPVIKTAEERINDFPIQNLPVKQKVTVYWNENLIPFIEAENDEDCAFMLGLVHAYLRLGQMEMFRMISQGRISEMFGPFTRDIDQALRIIDLGKAVPQIVANQSEETKSWLKNFTNGINWFIDHSKELPIENRLLNIPKKNWTAEDVYTLGRLYSVDLTWAIYFQFVQMMKNKNWQESLAHFIENGNHSVPSFSQTELEGFNNILKSYSKSGSNSLAISSTKSTNGSALLANDPHLGIFAPNMWLLVGYKSPSYHLIGMQIPGIPFVALGRNLNIAWGGTNMRSISSHLYEIKDTTNIVIKHRIDTIKVRGWFDRIIEVRESDYGPIISDAPFFKNIPNSIAIKWLGHEMSNELAAFLYANKATNFNDFRKAFSGYKVSGQNMLYADNQGNIGQVLAYSQPVLQNPENTLDLLKKIDNPIIKSLSCMDLPVAYNPKCGFIASANNLPVITSIPIAFAFPESNRMHRMHQICNNTQLIEFNLLKKIQIDVHSLTSESMKMLVIKAAKSFEDEINIEYSELWNELKKWNGDYDKNSRGPVAYEIFMYFLSELLFKVYYPSDDYRQILMSEDNWVKATKQIIEHEDSIFLKKKYLTALKSAKKHFDKYQNWGQMHELNFGLTLARIPLIGSKFKIKTIPVSGGTHTLMKTSAKFSFEKQNVNYGSNSRILHNMADLDSNFFVLFGGQDGWMSSPFNADQLELWENNQYINFPLRIETIKKMFTLKVHEINPL